jgi:cytochrome c peroxidase
MSRLHYIAFMGLASCVLAFTAAQPVLFEIPQGWPQPIYDLSKNKLTQEKVDLGRVLFYDPILSRDSTISCESCHSSFVAFTHVDHALSHGIEDRIGTRNAPSLMNLAWQRSFMWDGAINHLDMQALAPITNPLEMDEKLPVVLEKLRAQKRYRFLFERAFGDTAITTERLLRSMSAFMVTLVSSNSKYDRMKRGEVSFTQQELQGYAIFQQHCNACHTEPLFTNGEFARNGLPVDPSLRDLGRFVVTQQPADSFLFKVPTLRNIAYSKPYMHDGRMKGLNDVLQHYASLHERKPKLNNALDELPSLTSNERVDLVAFLLTLSDSSFVMNRAFAYPKEIISALAKE